MPDDIADLPHVQRNNERAAARASLHNRVENDFKAHPPLAPETAELLNQTAALFENVAHAVIESCPLGRELSLCLSDLESAKRNAIAAIACHQDQLPWS